MKQLLPRKWRQGIEPPIAGFQREMNRLMESFLGRDDSLAARILFGMQGEWAPSMDVTETENSLIVKAEVPGLAKNDIEVAVTGDTLTISGEKKDERKQTKGNYRMVERRYGSFRRSVTLPPGVDADKTQAEFKNGVLTITAPKTEETRPKKIAVRGE